MEEDQERIEKKEKLKKIALILLAIGFVNKS